MKKILLPILILGSVFTFDLNFSSDNKKIKEEKDVKTSDPAPDTTKSK